VTAIQRATLVHVNSSQASSVKLCFLSESWMQRAASPPGSSDEDSQAELARSLSLAPSDGKRVIAAGQQRP